MKLPAQLFLSLVLLVVSGCQTSSGPTVNQMAGRDFRTFFVAEAGGLGGVRSHLDLLRGAIGDIAAELSTKGYLPVAQEKADLVVEPEWSIVEGGIAFTIGDRAGNRTVTAVKDVELLVAVKSRATGQVVWKHSVWIRAARQQATPLVRHELVRELFVPFPRYVPPKR